MNPHLQQILHDITVRITKLEEAQKPRRTWVGLDEEDDIDWEEGGNLKDLVKAVEAKLRSKNNG